MRGGRDLLALVDILLGLGRADFGLAAAFGTGRRRRVRIGRGARDSSSAGGAVLSAASLAVGAIRDVPVVTKGVVTAGRRMTVTLSCDHRAIDGVQGAQFLKEVKRVLEHPQELVGSEEIA